MATVTFHAARLKGVATIPPAKSEAHRALLLAAMGHSPCRLNGFALPICDDTQAMINGVTALGATVELADGALLVTPATLPATGTEPANCEVHACAAALRMLIPAFLSRGRAVRFTMENGLFARPLDAFVPLMHKLDATFIRTPAQNGRRAMVTLSGFMPAGKYEIDGSLSSQYASGLLIALSHAQDVSGTPAPATLRVTPPIVSRPYLDMTLAQMRRFGHEVPELEEGLFSLSPTSQAEPAEVDVAPDWSQAATFLCANAMGNNIILAKMRAPKIGEHLLQGDARIVSILREMGLRVRNLPEGLLIGSPSRAGLLPLTVDCADIPDLAPILALTCTQAAGGSTLTSVGRLRVKECDRLEATHDLLTRLGARVEISEDGDTLRIWGPTALKGGFSADARGDHRVVMLLATAALKCDDPIELSGVEAVHKSWPGFLPTYQALGGEIS